MDMGGVEAWGCKGRAVGSWVPVTHRWAALLSWGCQGLPKYLPQEFSPSLGSEGTLPQGLS